MFHCDVQKVYMGIRKQGKMQSVWNVWLHHTDGTHERVRDLELHEVRGSDKRESEKGRYFVGRNKNGRI